MEQSFEVIDVEASKVYKTEVEKQQILEYMKYRAPVCMADMVLDKIDQIKDNKKMMEAMEAEADFAEAMEECQDAFEDAKNKLDELNEQLKYFPYDSKINQDLDSTEMEYKRGLSMAFMIRAAIGHYNDYNKIGVQNASTTQQKFDLLNGAMTSFINAAKQVSLGNPLDETSYNQFMAAMYYKNTIDALGGEDNLLTWYDELNTPAEDEESDEEDSSSDGEDQARKDLSDSITDYKNKRDAIMPGYKQSMDQYVRTNVYKWGDTLNNYWTSAQSGEIRAKNAKDALNIVKEKLENAAEKHAIWKEKTDALSNPGSMKDEVEKYENMFDTTKCEQLINKVESDEATFKRIQEELKGEKFFDQSLATVDREHRCRSSVMKHLIKIEIAYFFSEGGSCIVKEKKNSQTGGICMKYTYNKEYLMRDEKPWFPVMGEFHYSRYRDDLWEESLRKMKAGGVTVVSTYAFWIHHEEEEGVYDFNGCRNIGKFLNICKKLDLPEFLRIGPWCHGEVRNGGFSDWLLEKQIPLRCDDPAYLVLARRYWEMLYQQVKGEMYEVGGSVIGIQIENEYGHVGGQTGEVGEQHMRTLQKMAKEIGFRVPLYTATGWGGAVTGGMLPVIAGYCEAPWDSRLTELEANENYVFTGNRNDTLVANDHHVSEQLTFDPAEFPYLTAELGGGLQPTDHRRPGSCGN